MGLLKVTRTLQIRGAIERTHQQLNASRGMAVLSHSSSDCQFPADAVACVRRAIFVAVSAPHHGNDRRVLGTRFKCRCN